MARELPTSTLSDDDYAYWEARLPRLQLANLVAVYGREGSESAEDAQKRAENAERERAEAQAKAEADRAAADAAEAEEAARAAAEADAAQAAANAGDGDDDDEDLIGAPAPAAYDPLKHKVDEVQKQIDEHPEDADAIRAAEAARTDREPRTSITGYKVSSAS